MFFSLGKYEGEVGFEIMMKLLLENNSIQKDLTSLRKIMWEINLDEVSQKLEAYREELKHMTEFELTKTFSKEFGKLGKQS